jgi:hypothetical protein
MLIFELNKEIYFEPKEALGIGTLSRSRDWNYYFILKSWCRYYSNLHSNRSNLSS